MRTFLPINNKDVICLGFVDAGPDFAKASQVDFTSSV